MASKNDDLNRSGNRSTPQGSSQASDPISRDREMNRDRKMGQGSSGAEQGRQGSLGPTGTGSTGTGSTGTGPMGSDRGLDRGSDRSSESANRSSDTGRSTPRKDLDE